MAVTNASGPGTLSPPGASTAASTRPSPSRPASTRRWGPLTTDRWSLVVALGLTTLVFALSWYRHATFRSSTLDLAVFEQAVWKLAHFNAPEITTIGWNAFADHLSPVLFLFVPLYWIAATPLWLFAGQALAIGVGYLAFWPALEAAGTPDRLRRPLLIAFLASPLLWNAALFDFHPTTMALPFVLIGIRSAFLSDRRGLILCSLALVFLRDDLGVAVAALALCGITRPDARETRTFRLVLAGAGVAWMVLGGAVATALGSDHHWAYHYGYVAATPAQAVLHPLTTLVRLADGIWRAENILLLVGFLLPLGLFPLLRPLRLAPVALLALPLLASAGPQFHYPKFHYGLVPLAFLLVAAAAGLQRLPERLQRHTAAWLVLTAIGSFWLLGPPGTHELTKTAIPAADARPGSGADPARGPGRRHQSHGATPGPPGRARHVPVPLRRRAPDLSAHPVRPGGLSRGCRPDRRSRRHPAGLARGPAKAEGLRGLSLPDRVQGCSPLRHGHRVPAAGG